MMMFMLTLNRRALGLLTVFIGLLCVSGCSTLMSAVTSDLADDLARAMLDNNDLETVETGGPAYLLMIDGLLLNSPKSENLLLTAAKLYGQYANAFVNDTARATRLTEKAIGYAQQALCLRCTAACNLKTLSIDELSKVLDRMEASDVPALYGVGAAWAAMIQAQKEDWKAIADIPKVTSIMNRILALDEVYEDGSAHLYLGIFNAQIPAALGGKPDVARKHFERALMMSGGKNHMVNVLFAKYYARLVFDRKLHDELLTEIMNKDPNVPGYVLVNTAARQQAKALLESGDDYF